ncbi:major facilitator superfamily domain-containing protein 12-like [Lingula anatina]|uniref:Major facilitator superfamily domain-containing protein 12-like n=1 Tax=Lingula anatina TaxID=7574 RepID=A0A1S3I099_LINAN|nr:major facilitator superfamily domain-containing protein 12-like [Lingula anatina]XP_013390775.1 major facilitator superfamily domain-containing protein 12-like [Lingula anatina]|eukprot:XP_013390774.1 major facilitator superfamily domain-containing protein 12-like [Lingula anatina]
MSAAAPPGVHVPAKRTIPLGRRLAYSVGHVLNDLCAAMWFTYLLVYFHGVVKFNNIMAGNLMLVGQISDGICTPLVGYESDRTNGFCGYGKRKSWHLLGVLCVACTFPFLFISPCAFGCENSADWAKFIYYVPFVVIFQFGWAATQISHLSLIPELTNDEGQRVELNAIRYAFTVMSTIAIYLIAWLLLRHSGGNDLTPKDADSFMEMGLIAVGIGFVFCMIFHIGTKEVKKTEIIRQSRKTVNVTKEDFDETKSLLTTLEKSADRKLYMKWNDWFKEHQFYMIGALYMCTRLVVNLTQVYIPMYLTDTLYLDKQFIAIVPLIMYVSGFLTSVLMRLINKLIGKKFTYLVGGCFVIGACAWCYFITQHSPHKEWQVIAASVLLGAGSTTMLITSLAMTSDLIGENTESGAFVYGFMSLLDKCANGAAVMVVQALHPCTNLGVACCPACTVFYQRVISFVPGGFAILALLNLLALFPQKIGTRRKQVEKRMKSIRNTGRSGRESHSPSFCQQNYEVCPSGHEHHGWVLPGNAAEQAVIYDTPHSSRRPSIYMSNSASGENDTWSQNNTGSNYGTSSRYDASSHSVPGHIQGRGGKMSNESPGSPESNDVTFQVGATPSV